MPTFKTEEEADAWCRKDAYERHKKANPDYYDEYGKPLQLGRWVKRLQELKETKNVTLY